MPAKYPMPNFHFQVEWGGYNIGFTRVRNLSCATVPINNRHGASPEYFETTMPGRQIYEPIFFDRPVFAGDNEFFDWWNTVALNTIERRDLTISLLNEAHEPVVVWKVKDAYPIRLSWSDLDAHGNGVLMETLEVDHEGITVQND